MLVPEGITLCDQSLLLWWMPHITYCYGNGNGVIKNDKKKIQKQNNGLVYMINE